MTLTEEQKRALERVVAYMDEMYAVASPYYGCTEDANLLRAMIDSSGTVEPTGGFDLEKARAGISHYRIENPSNVDTECALKELVDQANLAEDVIAEIERLRPFEIAARDLDSDLTKIAGERDDQAARIKSLKKEIRRLKHESKVEVKFTNSYIKRLHDAEARIEELEDALVEGLTNFLHYRASCYDPARRCPYAKECDDCSTWDACGHVEKFRSEARRQLQAEGEIGSGGGA